MLPLLKKFTRLGLGLFFACFLVATSAAQDDPFAVDDPFARKTDEPRVMDGPDREVNVQERMRLIEEKLPKSIRLIIRSIRETDPNSPVELSRAVESLMDVQQYVHARYYLDLLSQSLLDDDRLFEIKQVLGSDFVMNLFTDEQMQPQGRQLAKRIFDAAERKEFQPARIENLVKTLSDEDISIRSTAFRSLRRLGEPATAAIINVFADPGRSAEFPFMRGALQRMGGTAIKPLASAARASHPQVQVEAIRGLRHYPSPEAYDAMSRVYMSPKFPESLRRTALDTLITQYGYRQNTKVIEDRLYKRAKEFLTGVRYIPEGKGEVQTLWRWNPTESRLEPRQLAAKTVTSIWSAELATDLLEINSKSDRNRRMFMLAKLEAAKRIIGPAARVNTDAFIEPMGAVSAVEMNEILKDALKHNLIPAACGACEVIERIGSASIVSDYRGRRGVLVDAMLYGDRHLQYSAFRAIANLDPTTAFEGSSFMTAMAVFLAGSDGVATGVVGHRRDGMASSYAAQLGRSGVLGIASSGSRDLFRLVTSSPDVEFVVLSDTLNRPGALELAQQLRRDWRTKRLPMAILVASDQSKRRCERVFRDGEVMIVPFTLDEQRINTHVRLLRKMSDPWPVTADDRRRQSDFAVKWIAKIASDRQTYRFYNLGIHEQAVAKMLYLPGLSRFAAQILATLGTPDSQRELVNYASQSSLPLSERKAIVQAFVDSVDRSGTMLTTNQIRLQYDRYNASANEPKSTQELLGSILDAIESRQRATSGKNVQR